MKVLIKNIGMPKSCRACHLKMNCDACEGLECVCVPLHKGIGYFDDLLADKRRDDCPLVPVPPHGRLIDADVLKTKRKWTDDFYETEYVEVADIDDAPTILGAED